jgi:hypothetical protein
MKPQQNQNLGFLTPASQACAIEGCDPDFMLFSSVVIPPAAVAADLTAAFPGGPGPTGAGLWFFQKGLPELLQSRKEYVQGGNPSNLPNAIAGQIQVESMQVHAVGLQIASAYGNVPVTPHDMKIIADSAMFEMWLDGGTNTPDNPNFSDYSDISCPVVTMPSNVGLYGSTAETGSAIASLGVPGLVFAAELKQKPILQKGQLIGARLTFPPQTVANGVTVAQTAVPPALTTLLSGVLVRLFIFGKAQYKNRS